MLRHHILNCMNVFLEYIKEKELDISNMSSDEIVNAYNASGSSKHEDLKVVAERLPFMKRLRVLVSRLEEVINPSTKGEHASDNGRFGE